MADRASDGRRDGSPARRGSQAPDQGSTQPPSADVNAERHRAYLRLCRALGEHTSRPLDRDERALLRELGEDLFLSPPASEKAAARSCQAGGDLLADAMRAGRLDEAAAKALWTKLCACGPPGVVRRIGPGLPFPQAVRKLDQ